MYKRFLHIWNRLRSSPIDLIKKRLGLIKSYWLSLASTLVKRPKELVGVVIPIYKVGLTNYEKISLTQCLKVFDDKFPIIFVAPKSLSITNYATFCKEYKNIRFEFFDDAYFKGLDSYSEMMTTIHFYERFNRYKFILIHQLDVFVFKNELTYWCNQGYDYIGSPWLGTDRQNDQSLRESLPFWVRNKAIRKFFKEKDRSVGNGGFSLRNVRGTLFSLLLFKSYLRKWRHYEDTFFSIAVPNLNPFFKIPEKQIALKFSIELEPRKAYEILGKKLPFGCHAWEKRDPDFWKEVIASYGYKIEDTPDD